MTSCRHQELLIDSRMIEIMADCRSQDCQLLQTCEVLGDLWLADEDRDSLGDISSVKCCVIRIGGVITTLYKTEERMTVRGVDVEMGQKT